jgi:hypothetical protein
MTPTVQWTENADGTYSCVACGSAPFAAGRHCECPRGVAAKPTAAQVAHAVEAVRNGPPTIDDYERELYELGQEDADLTKAYRACRAAARSMYHGPTKRPKDGDITVHDIAGSVAEHVEERVSPRRGYECQRDSIRLRLMALDSQVKHNAERRKRLEGLYAMALKRQVFEAVNTDAETARILKGRGGEQN